MTMGHNADPESRCCEQKQKFGIVHFCLLFMIHKIVLLLLMTCDYHLVMTDHSDLKKCFQNQKSSESLKSTNMCDSFPSITPENSDALLH